jgi:CheY-like chemotaxis protein
MARQGTIRILLVEDEMLIRELAAEDLIDAGYDVVTASSGDEAFALFEAQPDFDLLFTDLRMPGAIDGVELARLARAMIPSLPVIYATGYDDPRITLSTEERCIRKPYDAKLVLEHLASLGLGRS